MRAERITHMTTTEKRVFELSRIATTVQIMTCQFTDNAHIEFVIMTDADILRYPRWIADYTRLAAGEEYFIIRNKDGHFL